MNIYQAIMKAADHIERRPEDFDFDSVEVPSCGTPGCALGWIGFFCGLKHHDEIDLVADHGDGSSLLKVDQKKFYLRMEELAGSRWIFSASRCATGLRLYAEKYHGDAKPNFARELEKKLLVNPIEVA